jgi:cytochrome c
MGDVGVSEHLRSSSWARVLGRCARCVFLLDFVRAVFLLALSAGAVPGGDAEHGKTLFETCVACHSERPDALGPSLKGVVGRKAAALEDFRYSNPMKRANVVWDDDNLREFIKDPQSKVKGNRMPYGGLTDASDIEDIIAYLKTLR